MLPNSSQDQQVGDGGDIGVAANGVAAFQFRHAAAVKDEDVFTVLRERGTGPEARQTDTLYLC